MVSFHNVSNFCGSPSLNAGFFAFKINGPSSLHNWGMFAFRVGLGAGIGSPYLLTRRRLFLLSARSFKMLLFDTRLPSAENGLQFPSASLGDHQGQIA